jgi:hypothetical protein
MPSGYAALLPRRKPEPRKNGGNARHLVSEKSILLLKSNRVSFDACHTKQ